MNKCALYKNIYAKLNESTDGFIEKDSVWNPKNKKHVNSYNSFIKWYDKQLNSLDKNELLDMLKKICKEIENDSLNVLKEGECCYNTGMNTIGMGPVIPAGIDIFGSGDRFDMPVASKKKPKPYTKK